MYLIWKDHQLHGTLRPPQLYPAGGRFKLSKSWSWLWYELAVISRLIPCNIFFMCWVWLWYQMVVKLDICDNHWLVCFEKGGFPASGQILPLQNQGESAWPGQVKLSSLSSVSSSLSIINIWSSLSSTISFFQLRSWESNQLLYPRWRKIGMTKRQRPWLLIMTSKDEADIEHISLIPGADDGDILGAWFMWPEGGFSRPRDLTKDSTLVVYFHGNSQDRGFGHRVGWVRIQWSSSWCGLERFLCTKCCSVSVSMCSPWIIDPLGILRELPSLKRFDDVQDENPDTMRMNLDNVA